MRRRVAGTLIKWESDIKKVAGSSPVRGTFVHCWRILALTISHRGSSKEEPFFFKTRVFWYNNSMKLICYGAAREVTGSCHFVDTGKTRFLVDCGMFQGAWFTEEKNFNDFGFNPKELDFVILTHAHLDHCGRLPKLCKEFTGPIYATEPTRDFSEVMLADSAHVILNEAKFHKHQPFYVEEDVAGVVEKFQTLKYHEAKKVSEDVTIEFFDAGHILGSAFVAVTVRQGRTSKRMVFSGDLGNPPVPLLKNTEFIDGTDILIIESTYGGRIHEPVALRHDLLKDVFSRTVKRGGNLMVPSFAIERTQQLLFELNHLVEHKEVPEAPVYVDSPLAIKATRIYKKYAHLYDKQSRKFIEMGDDLFNFPRLHYTESVEDSKAILKDTRGKVIIAGSGMANGGRIRHHLKNYLSDPKSQLLIVGFQPEGTLGRQLYDGAESVTIDGKKVSVKAEVMAIGSYSAHADQPKLLNWVRKLTKPKPEKVFIVHGEYKSAAMLADGLKQELGLDSIIPEFGVAYQI